MSVAVKDEWTPPIIVNRGVLQGDPASPLLFNLCVNTFLTYLDKPELQQLGFSWGSLQHRTRRMWLQYADDAIIITPDIRAAQQLLLAFERGSNSAK